MRIKRALVFEPEEGFSRRDIFIDGGRFSDGHTGGDTIDASGCYAIPGLIDLHIHGCVGCDFSSADTDGIAAMAAYQASKGVTALCATTLTLPEKVLAKACKTISRHTPADYEAHIAGIYLEGPFISPEKTGAQNPAYIIGPDEAVFRRLNEAAGGMVKLLAIAPEISGALELISSISGEVVCALAHTAAGYDLAARAFACGARQITHLYNAMPPFLHREPGVVGAAFDEPGCMAELICDNVHIHPSVVRATFRVIGDDRIILVSDGMMATGLGDGLFELGGMRVTVSGGAARLEHGGAIAGSASNLMDCVRTAVKHMGIPLSSAVKCATVNPARAIGVFSERGSITAGKLADLVLLDENLAIKRIFLRGKALPS